MWLSSSDFCESMCFTRHIKVVSWAKTCKQQARHFLEIPCKMASHVFLTVQMVFRGRRGKTDFAATPSLGLGEISAVSVALQLPVGKSPKCAFRASVSPFGRQ